MRCMVIIFIAAFCRDSGFRLRRAKGCCPVLRGGEGHHQMCYRLRSIVRRDSTCRFRPLQECGFPLMVQSTEDVCAEIFREFHLWATIPCHVTTRVWYRSPRPGHGLATREYLQRSLLPRLRVSQILLSGFASLRPPLAGLLENVSGPGEDILLG